MSASADATIDMVGLDTTDIDIHISLFAHAESNVGPVEAALEAIGAEPDPGLDGWRG